MDGYAVRVADVAGASEEFPAVLDVIGDVAAGQAGLLQVGPGQAARIMTGAPLPPGAEAVVPVEWTDGGLGEGPVAGMRARSLAPEGRRRPGAGVPAVRGTRARPREGQRRPGRRPRP
ncbi:Molybdopterin molybdenumtransferase 2 [Streptomyces glaucescens]